MTLIAFGVGVSLLVGLAVGLWVGRALKGREHETDLLRQRLTASQDLGRLEEQARSRLSELSLLKAERADDDVQQRVVQQQVVVLTGELASARAAVEALAHTREALKAEQARVAALQQALSSEAAQQAKLGADFEATARRYDEAAHELDVLALENSALSAELAQARLEVVRLTSQREAQLAAAEAQREQLRHDVSRMLGDTSAVLVNENQQRLDTLLAPLRDRLRDFEQKVDQVAERDTRDRTSLIEQLRHLHDTQTRLHHDADALVRALSGETRSRGEWAEVVLARLFETAGLTEGREYKLQVSTLDDEGASKRPDAVVYLPNSRAVVVDSKCPLSAFVDAVSATDDDERALRLDAYVEAIRTQLRGLSDKRYQELLGERTLDFVLMFIPSEAAFHAALHRAPGLYDEAFRRGVHLCSPGTLLAMLQVIAQVWRSEKQTVNARELADEAAQLLEKLAGFSEALDQVGRKLAAATTGWEDARKKLIVGRGSVRKHALKMVELGARLPQLAHASDFVAQLSEGDDDAPPGVTEEP